MFAMADSHDLIIIVHMIMEIIYAQLIEARSNNWH